MRKIAFVLLVAAAVPIAASGSRAAPLAARNSHTTDINVPVLKVDPTIFSYDIVIYAQTSSEGLAITETIYEPPVNLARTA
jgi:hypothetical protein